MSGIKSNSHLESEDIKYSKLYKKGYGQGPIDVIYKELNKLNITLDTLSVLDCGCGHSPILNIYNIDTYVGIDISTYQINQLNNKNKNKSLKYYQGSIDDLSKFKDNEFDYVWCSDVLEHIEENRIDAVFSEISRVSKYSIISMSVRKSKVLSIDKEQLHQTIKPFEWWNNKITKQFKVNRAVNLYRNGKEINAYLFITKND